MASLESFFNDRKSKRLPRSFICEDMGPSLPSMYNNIQCTISEIGIKKELPLSNIEKNIFYDNARDDGQLREKANTKIYIQPTKIEPGVILEDPSTLESTENLTKMKNLAPLHFSPVEFNNKDVVKNGKLSAENKNESLCFLCGYLAENTISLKKHFESLHVTPKELQCEKCRYVAINTDDIERHLKLKHSTSAFRCSQCSFSHAKRHKVFQHEQYVHQCAYQKTCDECGILLKSKDSLYKHKKVVHRGVREYKCSQCEYQAPNAQRLRYHINAAHDKIKAFSCCQCNFAAHRKDNLRSHMKNVHLKLKWNKEEILECDMCNKSFAGDENLKRHKKYRHNQHKDLNAVDCVKARYDCLFCTQMSYTCSTSLNQHIKGFHDKINDYNCSQCEYQTPHKRNVLRHFERIHVGAKVVKTNNVLY